MTQVVWVMTLCSVVVGHPEDGGVKFFLQQQYVVSTQKTLT